jgi:hypothetical protein
VIDIGQIEEEKQMHKSIYATLVFFVLLTVGGCSRSAEKAEKKEDAAGKETSLVNCIDSCDSRNGDDYKKCIKECRAKVTDKTKAPDKHKDDSKDSTFDDFMKNDSACFDIMRKNSECAGFLDTMRTNFELAKNKSDFGACTQQLKNVQTGFELAIDEKGDLSSVKSVDDICHYILPGHDDATTCSGMVQARVDEVCEPGTLSAAPVDNFTYNVKAQAKDASKCKICVTERAIMPMPYDPSGACANYDCRH